MKKQLQRNYGGFIALLSVFVLTFLGLGACANPLQSPTERSPDGSTGVRINIVAGEARTLLPTAEFSKYVLSFSTDDNVPPHSDVTITSGNTDIISLDPADWTITVTAYVEVEDVDVAAAEGSAQVSLGAGELKGVSIRVSSKLGGANGYFSYDLSYPGDVHSGSLNVYDSGGISVIERSLPSEPSEDRIALAAGYYGLRVKLETRYGMANRTEIVHIYPGMETRWDYAFNEADFGSPVTISGTVDLSGLGAVDMAAIVLYRNSDFSYAEGYFSEDNPSDTWEWSARTLPFNQPTDLYVALGVQLSDGHTLIKQLPAPVTVYDQDAAAPAMGPFTVNRFDLSGAVDFSALASLGVTNIDDAEVEVYQDGNIPIPLGGSSFSSSEIGASHPWSFGILTEEASLPILIMLRVHIQGETLYDQIQITLTGSRSDLNFTPGPVSAGTTINGVGADSGNYGYLFVPDAPGPYAFNVSGAGSQYVSLTLYDALGNTVDSASGFPDAALSSSLAAGGGYYIRLELESSYRAFQFRVDPVSQASLGGIVDFSGLLSPFSGVTVSAAAITIYADTGAHTQLGASSVNTGNGSWSTEVDLAGPSAAVVFVIAANLSNGQTVYDQAYGTISGSNSGLNFSPAAVGINPVTRATINQYDYLLYVPETTGDYSLTVSAGADRYIGFELYDIPTENYLSSYYGNGKLELIQTLNAGNPYRITVYSYSPFETYQFQVEALQPATLGGTVSLSGLAPISSEDINYTEIRVYNGAANPVQLGQSVTVAGDGSWSAVIPAFGTQVVKIAAYTYLHNGQVIIAHRQDTISGNTAGLNLAPAAVLPVGGQPVPRASSYYNEDSFLLVPSTGGFFNLGTISDMSNLNLYLYDAATGAELARGLNSLYASLIPETPYIVRVDNIGVFMAYQFQLSAIASTTSIGGSVNYSGLPSSISSLISSATISGYLEPSHTQIVGAPVAGNAWSALVPSNAVGQTVRLVLTLNLDNGLAINSHIQTVLSASASDIDFAPRDVSGDTTLNGRTAAYGDDYFLFIPEAGGVFTLQAETTDTYTGIEVSDGLTGNWIANSWSDFSTALTVSLSAGNPYVIRISSGQSFHDYQFYIPEKAAYIVYAGDGVAFKTVSVPGGLSFPTGTDDSGSATVTDAYEIGETAVTYELWHKVRSWAEDNGYNFYNNPGREGSSAETQNTTPGPNMQEPVTMMTWFDAVVWMNALTEWVNEKTGSDFTPVYYYDSAYNNVAKNSDPASNFVKEESDHTYASAYVKPGTTGFRLPSSNEWELAARWRGSDTTNTVSGYTNPYFTRGDSASGATANYNDATATGAVAWSYDNIIGTKKTQAVKGKAANGLGLYDMSGNGVEWCYDWIGEAGNSRILRGSEFYVVASGLQIGFIYHTNPENRSINVGILRPARTTE